MELVQDMRVLALMCCFGNINFGGGVKIDVGAKSLEVINDASFSSADCVLKF